MLARLLSLQQDKFTCEPHRSCAQEIERDLRTAYSVEGVLYTALPFEETRSFTTTSSIRILPIE